MLNYSLSEEFANLEEYRYVFNSYIGPELLENFLANFSELNDPDDSTS